MTNTKLHLLVLVALGAMLFFFNTWGYDLWPADEPRFGEIPREMMQSGNYLAPYCNGEPYKEKPPLLFWAIAASSAPFGDVTEFSARFPSGLAALGVVLLTFLLGRRLFNARVGFWSALILMTMTFFWTEARSVRTDMLLTLWMTATLYSFLRWNESKSWVWLVAAYGAITLGLFTKGPAALAFPCLFILGYYWGRREERKKLHWILGILAAVALVLIWYIPARMALPPTPQTPETASVGKEMYHQIIGRMFLGVSKAEPPWYYILNIPPGMLPWTLFLPWTIAFAWKHRRDGDNMRLLLSWLCLALIFFSLSVGKRHVYILPVYPVLAILTAQAALSLADGENVRTRKWLSAIWGVTLIVIGFAPLALLRTEYKEAWSPIYLSFTICGVAFGLEMLRRALKTEARRLHASMAAHFVVLAIIAATMFYPALDRYKGASDFCRPIRDLSVKGSDFRLYSVAFSREEYVFYSRCFHKRALMEDLEFKTPKGLDKKTEGKFHARLLEAVGKGLNDAGLTEPESASVETLKATRGLIEKAIAESGVDQDYAQAFMGALNGAVADFENGFLQQGAAFAYIQRQDWLWLAPFLKSPADFKVAFQKAVGEREMLLLANANGLEELKATTK
jgi:4-amino-4-deoxy-L-arabinose transferase-like glycosyltransferase